MNYNNKTQEQTKNFQIKNELQIMKPRNKQKTSKFGKKNVKKSSPAEVDFYGLQGLLFLTQLLLRLVTLMDMGT